MGCYDRVGTRCSGGPQSGTVALDAALEERFGGVSYGYYNCRNVRVGGVSGSTLSLHAEGRALDREFPNRRLTDRAIGWLIANWGAWGVQEVIDYDQDRRWTCDRGWQAFSGGGHGHIHVSQNWAGARMLTSAFQDDGDNGGAPMEIPEWAKDDYEWAEKNEILSGEPRPGSDVNEARAMAFLHRTANWVANKNTIVIADPNDRGTTDPNQQPVFILQPHAHLLLCLNGARVEGDEATAFGFRMRRIRTKLPLAGMYLENPRRLRIVAWDGHTWPLQIV